MPQIRQKTVRQKIALSVAIGIAALLICAFRAPGQDAPAGPIPGATPSDQPVSTHSSAQNSEASRPLSNLAGTWKLNKDQSDDPRQKMQEAAQQNGGGGGGWGGGMGGGRRGGGQGGGQRSGGMLQDYSELTITQTDLKTQVIGDSGRLLASTDNPAGNSSNAGSNNSGSATESDANRDSPPVAEWHGRQLIVTEPTRRGTTTRTYELSPEGKQLYVTTKIDNPRFNQPITIRFVYDPAKQGG